MIVPTFLLASLDTSVSRAVSISGKTLNWLVGYSGGGSGLVNVDRHALAEVIRRAEEHMSQDEPPPPPCPPGTKRLIPQYFEYKDAYGNNVRAYAFCSTLVAAKAIPLVEAKKSEDIERPKSLANSFSHQRYFFWLYHRPEDQKAALSTRQLFLESTKDLSDAAHAKLVDWLKSTKGEFPELEKDDRYRDGFKVLNEILPAPLTMFERVQKLAPPIETPNLILPSYTRFKKQQPYPVEPPHPVTPAPIETPSKPSAPAKPSSMICPPGQFWDGQRCRGSVSAMPNIPGGLPASGGAAQAVSFPSAMGMAFVKRLGGAMGLEA